MALVWKCEGKRNYYYLPIDSIWLIWYDNTNNKLLNSFKSNEIGMFTIQYWIKLLFCSRMVLFISFVCKHLHSVYSTNRTSNKSKICKWLTHTLVNIPYEGGNLLPTIKAIISKEFLISIDWEVIYILLA